MPPEGATRGGRWRSALLSQFVSARRQCAGPHQSEQPRYQRSRRDDSYAVQNVTLETRITYGIDDTGAPVVGPRKFDGAPRSRDEDFAPACRRWTRPCAHHQTVLGLVVYGILNRQCSSRELESPARRDAAFWSQSRSASHWLLGLALTSRSRVLPR